MDTTIKLPLFTLALSLTALPLAYGMNPNEELLKNTEIADPKKVLKALHNGANVNIQDNISMTPLHLAAYMGNLYTSSYYIMQQNLKLHFKATKILLDAGADVNAQNADGKTPLDLAIMKYNTEIAELITSYLELLKQIQLNPTKQLLTQAIDFGFASLVKLLLKADIKPDAYDLDLVKQKYKQSSDKFDKDTYVTIGRMLLQHLRLTGKLQVPEYNNTIIKFYYWIISLLWRTNTSTTKHTYGPISKSGIAQTGLPEDISHTIASFTH